MKVVYTDEALRDLDSIADWLIAHYPAVAPAVERRIRDVIAHIALARKRTPFGQASRCSRRAARPLPLQDFLSHRGRHRADTPYPSRRAAAMG
jgi:plasmid stabilization system protein ParE